MVMASPDIGEEGCEGRGGAQGGGDDGCEWYSGDRGDLTEGSELDDSLGARKPRCEEEAMVERSGGEGDRCLCCLVSRDCCRSVFFRFGATGNHHSSWRQRGEYWRGMGSKSR